MIEEYRVCRVCLGTKHIERFYKATNRQGKVYRRRVCATCVHRDRVPKRVLLTEIRPYLLEVVTRCGGIKPAARRLDTQPTVVRRWLSLSWTYDRGNRYRNRRMARESAANVLEVLRVLRTEQVFYDASTKRRGPKPKWLGVDDRDTEYKRKRRAAA